MKKLFLMLCFFSFININYAQERLNKNKSVEFAVAGNCEMCKKRIEKAAYSVKGVKTAQWDIDCKDIHIIYNETKCTLDEIKMAIAKAGHDTDTIKATDENYNNLHTCCLYRSLE